MREPIRLADDLTQVDLMLGAKAAQRGLQLRFDSSAGLLTTDPIGDPLRPQQILTNLVGNAIKFTAQGSILICLRALPSTDQRALLRVEVIDIGLGNAAEDQARILSLFEQVDDPFCGSTTSTSLPLGGASTGPGVTYSAGINSTGSKRHSAQFRVRGHVALHTRCTRPG